MLLRVAAVLLLDLLQASLTSIGVRRESARMRPRRVPFQRDHARRRRGQHRTVVRDEQDRLRARADLLFEPVLAVDVEEVVRLVQQQHVEVRAEQHLERESLALSAGERLDATIGALGVALPERRHRALVPHHLGPIAAGVLPRGQGVRVHEMRGVVGSRELRLRACQARAGGRDRGPRVQQQELPHRRRLRVRADELPHQPDAAIDVQDARRGGLMSRDDPEQRRLADPVRADERSMMSVRNPERDALEERPASWERIGNIDQIDHCHSR